MQLVPKKGANRCHSTSVSIGLHRFPSVSISFHRAETAFLHSSTPRVQLWKSPCDFLGRKGWARHKLHPWMCFDSDLRVKRDVQGFSRIGAFAAGEILGLQRDLQHAEFQEAKMDWWLATVIQGDSWSRAMISITLAKQSGVKAGLIIPLGF